MVLAELERIDEAIPYHQEAIELAEKHELPELEGEQFMMLAMAYWENGDLDQARLACETAVTTFTNADLNDKASKAQDLLAEMG
jgi:tetratricopeptide (TPR) repeat protein